MFQVALGACIVPDMVACSALISALEKSKQPECALEVF